MNPTDDYYMVENGVIVSGPHRRPAAYGPATPASYLASGGWFRLWTSLTPEAQPGPFYYVQHGDPVILTNRIERADTWVDKTPAEKRDIYIDRIYQQVPQYSATDVIIESTIQEEVGSWSDQAWAKKTELDNTPDDQLDTFDPTLSPPAITPRSDGLVTIARTLKRLDA
jgi:hypothetical protein